ncbi:NAD(FAD)-utilizing dehydrogenase [Roseomonas gilardii]|uniref:NAD(FAD)-utilizing dehydrogenase n=1 Tax=Roseomonas gilardii TaxID=257708 RepID=A0A1L7ABJ2_9PROT|nr:TIGR03862 family flavoprotein [Roseomonas gilardii]APT56113.1 NAD(FAD)-utilizing dehydrogenase [Roseomonas gilardii]
MTAAPPEKGRPGGAAAVAVVGAGPAGLFAAECLARAGCAVTVFDRMPSPARKLLIAGRGGLNLTHSEPLEAFLPRYGTARDWLEPAIRAFPPEALRRWCEELGQPTFTGSSGRVFPTAFKAAPLLRAWLRRLDALGVRLRPRHRWTGWDGQGRLLFGPEGAEAFAWRTDAVLLALGGASWPRLGSDAAWVPVLREAGIAVSPLRPANAGFTLDWSPLFRERAAGEPLKRVALHFGGHTVRGEAVVTAEGLEGGVFYALSAPLREAIARRGEAVPQLDLRPDLPAEEVLRRLSAPRRGQSLSNFLRKTLALPPVAIGLLREVARGAPDSLSDPARLASLVKALPLRLTGIRPIERAISSAGGIAREEVEEGFMLRRRPGVFVAGEMLDWEAPTGGYLLQACFSTGRAAAEGMLQWLDVPEVPPPAH